MDDDINALADETAWMNCEAEYLAYPIHLACSNENADCPDFVITALIKEAPLALRKLAIIEDGLNNLGPDYEETGLGRANIAGTPLHYYLERKSNINLAIVKELITASMMLLLLACPETVSGFFTLPPNETWLRSGRRWKRGRMS